MELKATAQSYYNDFGFNVLPVSNKIPKIDWSKWQNDYMTTTTVAEMDWNDKSNGIAAVCGIRKLRVLDFDDVKDYEVVKGFVKNLGLPQEYQWIVKSGSGKGYHIWFYCDDEKYLFDLLGGEKSYYNLEVKESGKCDHIELRWKNCQTVLPPSLHTSGEKYKYVHLPERAFPSQSPYSIDVGRLIDTVKELCVIEKERKPESAESTAVNDYPNKITPYTERMIKDAIKHLKGTVNNYDDWMRLGFALASTGEKGRRYFIELSKDNPNYSDSERKLNKKFDGFLKDYRGDTKLGTFFKIAEDFGWQKPIRMFWTVVEGKANITRHILVDFFWSLPVMGSY